jgi:hypothetical protein
LKDFEQWVSNLPKLVCGFCDVRQRELLKVKAPSPKVKASNPKETLNDDIDH